MAILGRSCGGVNFFVVTRHRLVGCCVEAKVLRHVDVVPVVLLLGAASRT